MRTIDEEKLKKRHESMVKYQKDIFPFTPTMRELQKLWGLNTTSAVFLCLNRMKERNMVYTRKHGGSVSYYAK